LIDLLFLRLVEPALTWPRVGEQLMGSVHRINDFSVLLTFLFYLVWLAIITGFIKWQFTLSHVTRFTFSFTLQSALAYRHLTGSLFALIHINFIKICDANIS
jgi:hypothetical protein